MDVKYSAAVEVFAKSTLEILVPFVAVLEDAYHQPLVFSNVTLVKLQPLNAHLPILVTLSGMVILVKLPQPKNASSPILVTLSGIVILVKLPHQANA